jgi:hypothetical protein
VPVLRAGEHGALLIEGGRLWRSTEVTVGTQRATSIRVLPNMEAIIAEFCVDRPITFKEEVTPKKREPTAKEATADQLFRVPVQIWTSEGMAHQEYYARIAVPDGHEGSFCPHRTASRPRRSPPASRTGPSTGRGRAAAGTASTGRRRRGRPALKRRYDRQKDLLRPALEAIIDMGYPLVRLAREIDWGFLDTRFAGVCAAGADQPGLPAGGGAVHPEAHARCVGRGVVRALAGEPVLPVLLRRIELLPLAAVRPLIDDALAPAAGRGGAG